MKMFLVGGVFSMACALSAFAESANFTIDSTHTFPSFEISHLGFSTQRGRFNSTQGSISVDMERRNGTIDVVIDAKTVNTGLDKLEEHLRGEKFFNVEKFPTITFKSSNLAFSDDNLVGVDGELTMLGVAKPVHLNITNFKCGTHPMSLRRMCGVDAVATIKRSDFGMTYGIPAVGDEVKLMLQVEAFQAAESGERKH